MSRAALFLDRDGVLNVDHGYVFQVRDFELIDGVLDALRTAADRGYVLIIVTNQSGIGRGYFSQADYDLLEAHIRELFAAEGIPLAAIYHCPHHPDAGCTCRKPQPGMILQAASEHGVDLTSSILIGDKPSDAAAGRAAKVGHIELVTPHRTIVDIVAELEPVSPKIYHRSKSQNASQPVIAINNRELGMNLEYSIDATHVIKSALSLLRPYDVLNAPKIRVGRPFDGGYIMIDSFDGVEAAYSLGINDDVSWDLDMSLRDIDIFQYDHTIESLPAENPRFHWEKLGIAASSSEVMRSISDLIKTNGHQDSSNLVLKCDIECAEWDVLRHIPNAVLSKFSQIVLELHDIRRLGNPGDDNARQAVVNLTNSHHVVHVHGNNFGGVGVIGGICLPNVIELTLLRKDMGQFTASQSTFPTPMDMPCNSSHADLYLGNFTFK